MSTPLSSLIDLACVAGARKGNGDQAPAMLGGGGVGKRKCLQLSHCLFRLSRSPANEKLPLVRF